MAGEVIKNLSQWHFPNLSVNDICKKLEILKFEDLYKFEIMRFLFQYKKSNSFLEKCCISKNPAVRENRATNELELPLPRKNTIKLKRYTKILIMM